MVPHEEMVPALLEAFREEAAELLADMESALMLLEERPQDGELVARAFRALHTIKGNAGMFGFDVLESLAHDLEHVFDLIRKGRMGVSGEIVSLTLAAKDRLQALLRPGCDASEEAVPLREIRCRIAALQGGDQPRPPAVEAAAAAGLGGEAGAGAEPAGWRIRLRPGPDAFSGGTDLLAVIDGLHALGRCVVTTRFDEVPPLERLDPRLCHLWWEIALETRHPLEELQDALIFVGGPGAQVAIERADTGVRPAPGSGGAQPAVAAREAASAERGSVRVGAARLDTLMNLVGELVTVQARLSRHAGLGVDPGLASIAEEVERLTGDLRDVALGIRMVPVRPAFGRFRRMVRDLAQELGREVDLVTEGEETELDKSLIDRLGDPVVHLLRNCIDHGIEPPAERERVGKPRRGLVRLGAYHAGPSVVIRVEDDGRGIDREAVRRKAVERGLLAKDESPPERELLALLFAPGFTTSTRLTSVSGRGVGLDVVKRAVEALRGAVRVESVPGAGTRFEIRLPLTLAIIEGLAVDVGEERFILPLASVRECVEAPRDLGTARRGCALVEVRGAALPFVCLRSWFAIPGEPAACEQLVVVEAGGRRLGLRVDRVVGGHQTVIKPLGRLLRATRGLGGSTILGDGSVALILDVEEFVQDVEGAAAERAVAG